MGRKQTYNRSVAGFLQIIAESTLMPITLNRQALHRMSRSMPSRDVLMGQSRPFEGLHTYQMILTDDANGCACKIEFEAPNALRAMIIAQQSFRERAIDLYEDERPLGTLMCDSDGWWSVAPKHA